MSDKYTPTKSQILEAWVDIRTEGNVGYIEEAVAEFNRWYNEERREIGRLIQLMQREQDAQ